MHRLKRNTFGLAELRLISTLTRALQFVEKQIVIRFRVWHDVVSSREVRWVSARAKGFRHDLRFALRRTDDTEQVRSALTGQALHLCAKGGVLPFEEDGAIDVREERGA